MKRTLSRAAAGLCLALALFFLLPLCAGILHFGMLWPAAVLTGAAVVLLWPDFFRRLLRPKWLRRVIACAAAVCLTAVLVTLGKMAQSAAHRPTGDTPCTVVVLGCQVYPDGHPSLMLQNRIHAAYDYLTAHPEAAFRRAIDDRDEAALRLLVGLSLPTADAAVYCAHVGWSAGAAVLLGRAKRAKKTYDFDDL